MDYQTFINVLKVRFEKTRFLHHDVQFQTIETILNTHPHILETMIKMEETEGEPNIIIYHNALYAVDCSKETPLGRRNVCFDKEARLSRKKFPPSTSAEETALDIGIHLIDESMYRYLQSLIDIDLKTSSWLETPLAIRKLGGALFGDKRYNQTFIYHNGADSYYGVRGFRGYIKLPI